jgi:hypothetical protein
VSRRGTLCRNRSKSLQDEVAAKNILLHLFAIGSDLGSWDLYAQCIYSSIIFMPTAILCDAFVRDLSWDKALRKAILLHKRKNSDAAAPLKLPEQISYFDRSLEAALAGGNPLGRTLPATTEPIIIGLMSRHIFAMLVAYAGAMGLVATALFRTVIKRSSRDQQVDASTTLSDDRRRAWPNGRADR